MNTIWTFGDSFIDSWSYMHYHEEQWTNQIADKLKLKHIGLGFAGAAASYTYTQFDSNIEKFNKNDIVIICVTGLNGKWFFKNLPYITNYQTNRYQICTSNDETNAIEYYRRFLDDANTINDFTYLLNFIVKVNYVAKKKKLKVIVLNSDNTTVDYLFKHKEKFDTINVVYYPLTAIEQKEMTKEFYKKWSSTDFINDCRINHLCRSNHDVLANKIVDYINYGTNINLNNGFIENILDFDKEYDEEFLKIELFGKKWTFWYTKEDFLNDIKN